MTEAIGAVRTEFEELEGGVSELEQLDAATATVVALLQLLVPRADTLVAIGDEVPDSSVGHLASIGLLMGDRNQALAPVSKPLTLVAHRLRRGDALREEDAVAVMLAAAELVTAASTSMVHQPSPPPSAAAR